MPLRRIKKNYSVRRGTSRTTGPAVSLGIATATELLLSGWPITDLPLGQWQKISAALGPLLADLFLPSLEAAPRPRLQLECSTLAGCAQPTCPPSCRDQASLRAHALCTMTAQLAKSTDPTIATCSGVEKAWFPGSLLPTNPTALGVVVSIILPEE
ncbi:hypothetical protein KIL84_010160 [Mauremys mutica]|uniref:Uncharacterized protein n=1 Tax=Mauremys mutica TaxID=74926 RepID=A0A9D3XMW7_9SAUR|nr:hypothetical protein KIL84_010160 [Mauremys mutica]